MLERLPFYCFSIISTPYSVIPQRQERESMAAELKHEQILFQAQIQHPEILDLPGLKDWTSEIVKAQGLKVIGCPHAVYVTDPGNEGPTGGCFLKTSHFAWHIWPKKKPSFIQADLYSCASLRVEAFIKAFDIFSILAAHYMVIDRSDGFKVIKTASY